MDDDLEFEMYLNISREDRNSGLVITECFCGSYTAHSDGIHARISIHDHWRRWGGLKKHLVDFAFGKEEKS